VELFFRTLLAAAVATAFTVGAAGVAQAATDIGTGDTSKNWAGYALQAGADQSFDKARVSYIQPDGQGVCDPAHGGIVAFAVAFDGFGNTTSEQAGTALQCSPNKSKPGMPFEFQHIAFWEMDPGPPHFVPPPVFAVNGGDSMTVTITYAAGTYTFKWENHTSGQSYTATSANTNGSTRTSVEAIAESPVPGGQAPLPNFGRISFRDPDVHLVRSHGNDQSDEQGDHENNGNANAYARGRFAAITMKTADGTADRAVPSFPLAVTFQRAI
jgi:hypothetical protein